MSSPLERSTTWQEDRSPFYRRSSPYGDERRGRRILLVLGVSSLIVIVGLFIGAQYLLHNAEPILRERVIETLAARFDSRVELAEFHVSVVNGLQVSGVGLKLYPNAYSSDVPLFAADQFGFKTTWANLLKTPMHVGHVGVNGLRIHLPPKQERHDLPKLNGKGRAKIKIYVREIDIQHAALVLGTSDPRKNPLDFQISRVVLNAVGAFEPMHFDATLVNPRPRGEIQSSGEFGPFHEDSPGDTPVKGDYTFNHADLSTLKGIAGILSSTGQYQGTLDNIVVNGETDTPDFRIRISGHPVPLHTRFHAIVDGTNGDTILEPVDATILHSHLIARGKVVRVAGKKGHDIALDVVVDKARIEDLLKLGVRTDPPVMTGAVRLKTKMEIKPGEEDVSRRLRLRGNFDISNVRFTNEKVQAKVDELSMIGQGKPKEAHDSIPDNARSEMTGNFQLASEKLSLQDLNFDVQGANIQMDGVYSMNGDMFDFHGKARLHAHLSEMVGGWKSILLKPIDPFFAKHGAGTEVPIKVTGTRSEPHFGLDFGHHDDSETKVSKDWHRDRGIVTKPN